MEELKWHHRHQPRTVNGIVEHQVRRWQFQPPDNEVTHWPVVTVSRESGSLGLALGRRVAERLGFTFWDQEIVTTVAEHLHIDPHKVLEMDEHAPGVLAALMTAVRLSSGKLVDDYRIQLRILFESIAHHGSALIVGRGAHCVLSSTQALRVRLVAPIEQRILDYERTCQTTHEEAARQVPAGDKERADFVRRTFQKDVTDPASYDLVINVATYSPIRAESLIMMAYLAKFGHLPADNRDSMVPEESGVIEPMRTPAEAPSSPAQAHP
jgi:hypothetical protein